MTDAPGATPVANGGRARQRAFIALGVVVALAGLAWAGYAFVVSRNTESTDDAYVGGDVVQITSEVPGTVLSLHVDDTQTVKAGDPVAELDPADARIAMDSAEAGLAQAVRRVHALFAQSEQLRAQVAARASDLKRAEDDLKRRGALIATGAVSREDFAHAQDNTAAQSAALNAARAELAQTLAQLGGTPVSSNPDVLSAAAKLRNAALALRRTRIVAPADGIIAKRGIQIGQHLDAGATLMAVVPLGNVWIDANFKEVQLQEMRIGQPVTVRTDLYGGKVTYHGKVAGVSAGSGNAFALLPAQNATGNWIKIVQRVPVRVLVDPRELADNPLRIGLSANVTVDVADQSGPLIASQVRNQPFPAKHSDGDDPAIDALIRKIIIENDGSSDISLGGGQ